MAKLGPPENGQFSPFAQMGSGIAALTQPAAAPQTPGAQGGPESSGGDGGAGLRPTQAPSRHSGAPSAVERPLEARPQPAPAVTAPLRTAPRVQVLTAEPRTKAAEDSAVTASLLTMKRFKVSTEESAQMEQASLRLAAKLGVKIDFSKITRALWQVYLKHEEDIVRNAAVGMTRDRPANDDAVGLAELDEQIAQIVGDGFLVASRRPANRS